MYADLLFVFSWTAVVHWIAIVLGIIGVCIRRAEWGLLTLADGELPRDAFWGERFFHVTDPDGHELSFAELVPTGS